jgi:hypothetical protein
MTKTAEAGKVNETEAQQGARTPDVQGRTSAARAGSAGAAIKWDTSSLKSSYANFCNANSTREEVVLNFGVNKTWERGPMDALDIELNHRVVLSPFAAKRLTELLQQLMKEYESRYGALPEK